MDSEMKRKPIIGVIGGGECTEEIYKIAEKVGKKIAENNAVLICGGLGGVMEAACKGAKNRGGTTIGILPGNNRDDANKYVDLPIATGMGYARNIIIVYTAQCLIAIDGKYGTLSEIAYALAFNKPVIGIKTHKIEGNLEEAHSPEEAVEKALAKLNE